MPLPTTPAQNGVSAGQYCNIKTKNIILGAQFGLCQGQLDRGRGALKMYNRYIAPNGQDG